MTGKEYEELKLWLESRGENNPNQSYFGTMAWYHGQLEKAIKMWESAKNG